MPKTLQAELGDFLRSCTSCVVVHCRAAIEYHKSASLDVLTWSRASCGSQAGHGENFSSSLRHSDDGLKSCTVSVFECAWLFRSLRKTLRHLWRQKSRLSTCRRMQGPSGMSEGCTDCHRFPTFFVGTEFNLGHVRGRLAAKFNDLIEPPTSSLPPVPPPHTNRPELTVSSETPGVGKETILPFILPSCLT